MEEKTSQADVLSLPLPSTLPTSSRLLPLSPASLISYHSPSVLGCSHYPRSCQVRAPCCPPSTFHVCRFCHDESVSEHAIDRHAISEMVCMLCAQAGHARAQPVGALCVDCGSRMAAYYCAVCRFFDDTPGRAIFHCQQCGICRRGSQDDFFHCQRCNCCYARSMRANHVCIDNVLEANCPICQENLFTSTLPVSFLACGHALHQDCLQSLMREPDIAVPIRCPSCKKSIGKDEERDAVIERYLEGMQMPAEYATWRAVILCNDCVRESELPYHFAFHRCPHDNCNSFNTDVLRSFRTEPDAPHDDSAAHSAAQQQHAGEGAGGMLERKEGEASSSSRPITELDRTVTAALTAGMAMAGAAMRPFTQAQDILAELQAAQAEEDDGEEGDSEEVEEDDGGEEEEDEEEEDGEEWEHVEAPMDEEVEVHYHRWQDDDDDIDEDDAEEPAERELDDAHRADS